MPHCSSSLALHSASVPFRALAVAGWNALSSRQRALRAASPLAQPGVSSLQICELLA